jgi:predicted HicB family RNase H-like nuclease
MAAMPELRIRDCPESLWHSLKIWAAVEDKSLNQLILDELADAVKQKGPKVQPGK